MLLGIDEVKGNFIFRTIFPTKPMPDFDGMLRGKLFCLSILCMLKARIEKSSILPCFCKGTTGHSQITGIGKGKTIESRNQHVPLRVKFRAPPLLAPPLRKVDHSQ